MNSATPWRSSGPMWERLFALIIRFKIGAALVSIFSSLSSKVIASPSSVKSLKPCSEAAFLGAGFVTRSIWISRQNTRPSPSAKFLIRNFGTQCWFSSDMDQEIVCFALGCPERNSPRRDSQAQNEHKNALEESRTRLQSQ